MRWDRDGLRGTLVALAASRDVTSNVDRYEIHDDSTNRTITSS